MATLLLLAGKPGVAVDTDGWRWYWDTGMGVWRIGHYSHLVCSVAESRGIDLEAITLRALGPMPSAQLEGIVTPIAAEKAVRHAAAGGYLKGMVLADRPMLRAGGLEASVKPEGL